MSFEEWCTQYPYKADAILLNYPTPKLAWQAARAEQAAEVEQLRAARDEWQRRYYFRDAEARELFESANAAERERDETKLQCADYQRKIDELCNQAWQVVYGKDRTDWEYPAQAIRHLEQFANEQCAAKDAALRQAKDDLISLAQSAGLNPNGFTAQIDAALNPLPRSIAEGERGAVESEQ